MTEPGALDYSRYKNLEWQYKVIVLQPWPVLINARIRREMATAAQNVFALIKSVPGRVFNMDPEKIGSYYDIPPDDVRVYLDGATDAHIKGLLGRGDFVYSPTRGFKCMEYNIASNLGGWEVPIWEAKYMRNPIVGKFLNRQRSRLTNKNLIEVLIGHLVESALSRFSPTPGEINIAVVPEGRGRQDKSSTQAVYFDQIFKKVLWEKFPKLKGSIVICNGDLLDLVDDKLFHEGKRIHSILEWSSQSPTANIVTAFKKGNITLHNGEVGRLMRNKLHLALLSESADNDSDFFSRREKDLIKKYIPWSRKTAKGETTFEGKKVDLEPFILGNREKLVLKPGEGYGGIDVFVGIHTSEEQWRQAAQNAIEAGNWVVQEYIQSDVYMFHDCEKGSTEQIMVFGFFVFGSTYGGGFARLMPNSTDSGVINCNQGATLSVLMEVDE